MDGGVKSIKEDNRYLNEQTFLLMKKILSWLFVMIVLGFLVHKISLNWSDFVAVKWNINIFTLIGLMILWTGLFTVLTFSWHYLVTTLGAQTRYRENARVWILSNAARYLPGTIWQYVGRLQLSSSYGIPVAVSSRALVMESLLNLIAGLMVIVGSSFVLNLDVFQLRLYLLGGLLVGIAVLFMLINNPAIINFVISITKLEKLKLLININKLSILNWLVLLILLALQFVIAGTILFLLTTMVYPLSWEHLPYVVVIYTLSWLLGYIAFLAPAGLGVQELSMATLLSFYLPTGLAGGLAIAFRVISMFVELIIFTFYSIVFKR